MKWTHFGTNLRTKTNVKHDKSQNAYILSIVNVDYSDKGTYECEGIDNTGHMFISRGVLNVRGK